jgi:tetratricopeptide (TPR) repeat protein
MRLMSAYGCFALFLCTNALAAGELPTYVQSSSGKEAYAKYIASPQHRAFAYSADGGFGYSFSQPNETQAKRTAIAFCEDNRPRLKALCQIVSVGTTNITQSEFESRIRRGYNDELSQRHSFYGAIINKDFAQAKKMIDELQNSVTSQDRRDQVGVAISMVERLPLDNGKEYLDHWVEAAPSYWGAYACRATFELHRAWKERGTAFGNRTAPEKFERVKKLVESAVSDAKTALRMNDRCHRCYRILINATMLERSGKQTGAIIAERGLKAFPSSVVLREIFLETLQPSWGGSESAMDRFVTQTTASLPREDADSISAHREYLKGFWAVAEKDQEKAFESALGLADHHSAAIRLAELKRTKGQHKEVLTLMERNLKNSPWDRYSLELKAIAHEKLGQTDEHFATIDKLLALKRRERILE